VLLLTGASAAKCQQACWDLACVVHKQQYPISFTPGQLRVLQENENITTLWFGTCRLGASVHSSLTLQD
jgi:hypothetical protein